MKPDCFTGKDKEVILNLPMGYLFVKDHGLSDDLGQICAMLQKRNSEHENLNRLRLYLSSMQLGILLGLIEEGKNPKKALDRWQLLPSEVKDSVPGLYVRTVAVKEIAKELVAHDDVNQALDDWTTVLKMLKDHSAQKEIKEYAYEAMFAAIEKEMEAFVIDTCVNEWKKLKNQGRNEDAIQILEKGITVTGHITLREPVAVFYVERGYEKFNAKKYGEARKDAEAALRAFPDHKGAKDLMALAYNNEATEKSDSDAAFELYKKAYEYNPENETIRNNLAGAYNGKAVKIMNAISLSQGSNSIRTNCDQAIELLEKGLRLLNPPFDPGSFQSKSSLDERTFNNQMSTLPEGLEKTMQTNLWVAMKTRSSMSR
jgi:tetratricopeptide (TPR) repeat protein